MMNEHAGYNLRRCVEAKGLAADGIQVGVSDDLVVRPVLPALDLLAHGDDLAS